MALSRSSYLYRVRLLFDRDEALTLVETVHKDIVTDDDQVIHEKERTQVYPLETFGAVVQALLAEIATVGAAEEARKADEETQRQQAEADTQEAMRAGEAVRKPMERRGTPGRRGH